LALVEHLQAIADKYGATSSQVVLAWILAEHQDCKLPSILSAERPLISVVFPIPGTRNVSRLDENARGAEITLSPEDVKAIRAWAEAADIKGARKRAEHASDGECIELAEWMGETD
jgi:aryl-alcohol dehydrogenase-like predicted oxidoreductase